MVWVEKECGRGKQGLGKRKEQRVELREGGGGFVLGMHGRRGTRYSPGRGLFYMSAP